jgi:hypothetical protein
LPCPYNVDSAGNKITRSDTTFCPGYAFDATTMNITDEWVARATTNGPGGVMTPVRTDQGVVPMLYNLATPYYPRVGQVICGAVLANDFEKTSDNVLRIIYSITQA